MYPSATYSAVKARRLRKIRHRACRELTRAYECGELSLRQFDLLSRLGARQQRRALFTRRQQISDQRLAADAINRFLDDDEEIDLKAICAAIAGSITL